ncbi:hypothetical protein A9K75_08935 [Campylobacter fetus subsp. testudinum]|uniref:hypothetical protein n=2 Tax=Campylobacter fetus TaxID=196 RepID=UPI000818B573|nr:hypothetical protein [Campylobacter fetus]OCR98995.1 hypothetical protein A9K75_08935 [Campylobacter fetus subsp. testudinum]
MAVPLILLASHMLRSSATTLLSFVGSYVTKQFIDSHREELTDSGYEQLSEQFNKADTNVNGNLSNDYSPNGKYLSDQTKTTINSILSKKASGSVLSENDYSILTYYGYEWSITQNKTDSSVTANSSSASGAGATVSKQILDLENSVVSITNALAVMNEYYASQDALNSAILSLQTQISSLESGFGSNPSVPDTATGGLIGAIAKSTAKLDAIGKTLVTLNTSTQNVASKTGLFSGKLEITNAKDMTRSVSVSAPDVKVTPQLTAILDVSKPIDVSGFSDLVSAQVGLKSLEDTRVKREEEAHDILKEKTDFLTKPRAIKDMDGNELANVAPREMALTHQASLARTYTDENTTTLSDLDLNPYNFDIGGILSGLKIDLVSDIQKQN